MKEYRSGLDVPRVRGLARFDPADHWSEEGLENVSNDHADDLGLIAAAVALAKFPCAWSSEPTHLHGRSPSSGYVQQRQEEGAAAQYAVPSLAISDCMYSPERG